MKDLAKQLEELNVGNKYTQHHLSYDQDISDAQELCMRLTMDGIISTIPNRPVLKALIQLANIIQHANGRMPYSIFVPLATGKESNIFNLMFAVAITRHIPGKGQNKGDIRPFEEALVGWRAFGKSREDEDIIAKALGLERADYIETKDYFSAGYGNFNPDLVDLNNGYTFDVKCFANIDSVNKQKNRTALFILLTDPVTGTVSLYAKTPEYGQPLACFPTTKYELVNEYSTINIKTSNDIQKYLQILKTIKVPSRKASSYEKPSEIIDGEELFTEDNFKILDILLACLGFKWPLEKK